jgi:hypothetical protein
MEITAPTVEIANAALFYAKALDIDCLDGTLEIEYIEDAADPEGMACTSSGWIEYADDEAVIYIRREYDDPMESQLEILAHEMVHFKQYLKKELIDLPGSNWVLWNKSLHLASNDPEAWIYWNSPWELEAFGRQQGLNYMRQVNEK